MDRRVIAVLLAGTLRPTPLREALGRPVVCLPLGRSGTLLDAWLDVLRPIDELSEIRVVLKGQLDVEAVNAAMNSTLGLSGHRRRGPKVHCLTDQQAWRGPGGILRDITDDLDPNDAVVVVEALRLPPSTLSPLVAAFTDQCDGVVGLVGEDQPAGVYVFCQHTLQRAAAIGYCDLKEQLIPALSQDGAKITTAPLGEASCAIRDRGEYLEAVRASLDPDKRIAASAAVSDSALLEGFCVIEPDAVIGDGVVVHDSVVLSHAVVGGGAVVSRSIIGASVAITPRCQIVEQIVCEPKLSVAEAAFEHRALAG